jgi:hypothetical protein
MSHLAEAKPFSELNEEKERQEGTLVQKRTNRGRSAITAYIIARSHWLMLADVCPDGGVDDPKGRHYLRQRHDVL